MRLGPWRLDAPSNHGGQEGRLILFTLRPVGILGILGLMAVAANHALGCLQAYLRVPDQAELDLRRTWALEAWVYPRAAGNGADEDLISKWAGVTDAAYILQIEGATGQSDVTAKGFTFKPNGRDGVMYRPLTAILAVRTN